jgi:transposase
MTRLSAQICADIARLFYAEHWKVGTIAAHLGLHPEQVKHVLGLDPKPSEPLLPRPRLVDPYRDFIAETLDRYPRLRATRIFDMVCERGYQGQIRTLREYVATVRPQPHKEAYLRTETLPGEQAQIDWAHVGKVSIHGTERALWLFVLVLAHSRAMWAEFVIDLSVYSLCRSLVRAADALGGVTRQFLFDNPKIVVLGRQGNAVQFHPVLLNLCGQLRVQPRLCAVRRPEHKGKVERTIRYLRERFLAGRTILGVDEGNQALVRFIAEIAHQRPHPTQAGPTVGEIYAQEQPRLLALPDPMPDTDLIVPVPVNSQGFIHFDSNRYSVPSRPHAHNTVTLVANDREVRLLEGQQEVARHARSFGKKQIIEDPEHRRELVQERRMARDAKGRDRLTAAAPEFPILLERWLEGGHNLAIHVKRCVQMLDLYGEDIFARAVCDIAARDLHDISALSLACEKFRRDRNRPIPIAVDLPPHIADCDVIPHALENYDANDDQDA